MLNLEHIMLNEIRQRPEEKICLIPQDLSRIQTVGFGGWDCGRGSLSCLIAVQLLLETENMLNTIAVGGSYTTVLAHLRQQD